MIELKCKLLHELAILPRSWSDHSVGLDLHALIPADTPGGRTTAILPPRTTRVIRTGISVEPPPNIFLAVCSRGGLASKFSIFVTNSPGIVDPDYRGEIMILLYNGGHETHYIKHGDRVAQLVAMPAISLQPIAVISLSPTLRGEQRFGSTGV